MTTDFTTTVQDVVRSIPKGKVASYGQVAMAAGSLGAARAVGTIMCNNQDSSVPCHRVVKGDGSIGGYNGICGDKKRLLLEEGIVIDKKDRVLKEFFV